MENENGQQEALSQPKNTAIYAMRVVSEIDNFIRENHGMGVLVSGGDGVVLAADGNGQIKASFTITLIQAL